MQKLIFLLLSLTSFALGQRSNFTDYFNARFAKTTGFGNAYAGHAEGVESTFYNPAGLANLNFYELSFSLHDGYAWFAKMDNNDFALAAPISGKIGTFAVSRNQISADHNNVNAYSRIYSLAYARKLTESISSALNLNYYHFYFRNSQPIFVDEEEETNIKLFDIGLSFLYRKKQINQTRWDDNFGFGLFFNNLIDSKHEYSTGFKEPKAQFFRAGVSYSFSPLSKNTIELEPINIVLTFDGSFLLKKYSFYLWQPNYGIQATFFEYLALRFGRQSEFEIKDYYGYSPQYPVNRFGFGLIIPISSLLRIERSIRFVFDYTYSDWNQIDESIGNSFLDLDRINRSSYSFKLKIKL